MARVCTAHISKCFEIIVQLDSILTTQTLGVKSKFKLLMTEVSKKKLLLTEIPKLSFDNGYYRKILVNKEISCFVDISKTEAEVILIISFTLFFDCYDNYLVSKQYNEIYVHIPEAVFSTIPEMCLAKYFL